MGESGFNNESGNVVSFEERLLLKKLPEITQKLDQAGRDISHIGYLPQIGDTMEEANLRGELVSLAMAIQVFRPTLEEMKVAQEKGVVDPGLLKRFAEGWKELELFLGQVPGIEGKLR